MKRAKTSDKHYMSAAAEPTYLRIGVLVVDDQHDALSEMIRRLEQAMAEGQGGGGAIPEILRNLDRYVDFHFGTEQRLMQSFGYPLADTHAIQHRLMVAGLRDAERAFRQGNSHAPLQFLDLMTHWAENHISAGDAPMGEYLSKKGVT
jgi:hemerythrin